MHRKLIIFDLDGVLIDSEPVHSRSIQRLLKEAHAAPFDPSENVGQSSEDMWARLIRENGIDSTPDEMVRKMTALDCADIQEHGLGAVDGLYTLLDLLEEKGLLLGLASSSERDFVEWVLKHLNIEKRFRFQAVGGEAGRKKPWPDLYLKVLELAGVPAGQAAAVEDSATGIRAAKSAGLYTVGYRNPTSGNQDLSAADAAVDRLLDAAEFLMR